MTYLINLFVSPYQRVYRAYLTARADDPVRAKWVYEFLPLAVLSVLASVLFFTDLTLFWAIGAWAIYFPLWVAINFNRR